MRLYRTLLPTPIGEMLALASDEGLCALEFTGPTRLARLDARLRRWFPPHDIEDAATPTLMRAQEWLSRYFDDGGSPSASEKVAPAATPSRGLGDPRRGVSVSSRWGWGPSASEKDIPLDLRGAPFEQRVWAALLEIPAGATSTYGAIARKLRSPGASRAVGMANGANPVAIIVPCHRVIGSNGTLTGYGGGLDRKTWLLNHEARWRTDRLF